MAASNHRAADNESAERPGDTRERTQTLPTAAVEAVVYMGYPSDLVLSTYHRLLSTRATESQHANHHHPPTSGATASTRNIPSRDVSAATLLAAVDDAIRHSSGGSSDTRISSGIATSSESSSGFGALQGLSVGEGMPPEHADVQQDGSEDEVSSTSRQHSPGHGQESLSHTAAVNSSRPFTDSQTPVSASQSSIIGNDQPSNAERAVSLMETSSTSASTGAEGSGSNSTTAASPTNAATASSGPHASSASMAETSAVTTEPGQVTPPSTSGPESTTASRDRSSERAGAGKAAPATEEEARERRRQLQARLRALRAENRRLKARRTCVHCRQKPVALTLLPCGHFILCEECGPSFEACPLCRKTIMADVKTYVS